MGSIRPPGEGLPAGGNAPVHAPERGPAAAPQGTGADAHEDSYAEEAPPSTLRSGAAPQSIAARTSPPLPAIDPARQSFLEERQGIVAQLLNKSETAKTIGGNTILRILEQAVENLQADFKPAKTDPGVKPTELQIKKALRKAYTAVMHSSVDKWDNEIFIFIKPFTVLIEHHAETLGLVGTREAVRRTTTRKKSPSAQSDPAWRARYDALPKQTRDGRSYVPYGGTDLSTFLGDMDIPRGARAFEQFKLKFYETTGITFDAFSRWGSIRRPPSRTDSDGIRRTWNALADQAIEESRIEPLLRSHRPHSVPADVWEGRIAIARERGMFRELAAEALPDEISSADWNLLVDYHARHHQLEDVSIEPARGEASVNAVVNAYTFLNSFLRSQSPGRALDLWDYLAAIYPVVRRMLVREELTDEEIKKLGAADFMTVQFHLPERILGGLDAETNLGLSTFAQRVWDGSFVSGVHPSTVDGHAKKRVEHPEHSTIRQYVGPLAMASEEKPEQRATIERNLYLLIAGLFRVFPVLDRLDPLPGREIDKTVPTAQRADTRMTLMPASDARKYATAEHQKRDEIEPKVRRGYYDARLALARGQIDHYSYLEGVDGISGVRVSLANGSSLSPAEMGARLESAAEKKQEYDDAVRRIPGGASHPQEAIRGFYSRLHEAAEEVIFWSQANAELATPLGAIPFVTALRRARQNFDTQSATVIYLDDVLDRAQAEGWQGARAGDAIRLRIIVGQVFRSGLLNPGDVTNAGAIAAAARPYWQGDASALDQAAGDLARMEAEALPADVGAATPSVSRNGIDTSTAREIIEKGPMLPLRRLSPPWREQWMAHAGRAGLPMLARERAVDAMMDYFENARSYLVDYNGQALGRAIGQRCGGLPPEPIKRAIQSFFAAVGMASRANALDAAAALQTELADKAFNRYIDGMPRERGVDARVEIDMDLLKSCVAAACESDANARPLTVLALAYARLQAFNSQRTASGISTEDGKLLPSSGLSGFMRPERAREIFERMVDDQQHGFTAFVREGYEATAMSDSQLREFALQYLAARLASSSPADINSIAASIIGQPAGFVPSVEVRERFAAYYRTLLHRWLSAEDVRIARELAPIHAAIEEAIDGIPPPMSVEELMGSAIQSVEGAPSLDALHAREEELGLLRGLYPRSPAYENVEGHATRLFHSADAAQAREEFLKLVRERRDELDKIAARAADIERRSAELLLGWDRVTRTGTRLMDGAIDSMLASIQAMNIIDLATFVSECDARYASMADIETELGEAEALPARARQLITSLGVLSSGETTAEAVETLLGGARAHLTTLEEAITKTQDAASTRLNKLRAEERERIALERARAAIENAKDVATEIDAAIIESRSLAPAVEVHETRSKTVSDQLRKNDITPDAFRTAMHEVAEQKEESQTLTRHADFLAERVHRLLGKSDEKIESGINLTMSPARTALADLSGAGKGLSEEGKEELSEAWQALDKAITDAVATIEEIDALIGRINAASAGIAPAIAAAEAALTIAPDAPMPDPIPEEELDEAADAALKASSSGKYHAEAQRALAPVLAASLISMPLRGQSRFISSSESARYNAWVESGRVNSIVLFDLFGRAFTLAEGERGSRLVSRGELPESSALFALVRNLSLALGGSCTEARAISMLARRPAAEALLQDLAATLARTEVRDSASARAAVRCWILAHRQAFCAAIGEADAEKFFPAEKPAASDRAPAEGRKKIEHIYPPSYTPKEHAKSVAYRDQLLSHPEVGVVVFTLRNGRTVRMAVDYFQARESINQARQCGFRELPEFREFNPLTGQWKTTSLPDDADPSTVDFERPPTLSSSYKEMAGRRLVREIAANPNLRDLGYASKQMFAHRTPAIDKFFQGLLDPIARTLPGIAPSYSLKEAQETAREVFLHSKKYPEFVKQFERIFCDPDPELAGRHPETALVNSIALLESAARITALPTASMLASFRGTFPEFEGVYAILDLLGSSIGEDYMEEFAGICMLHEESARSASYDREEFRQLFRKLYDKYAVRIQEMLREELAPGLTRARLLTGLDEPWKGELTWDRLTPMQRLVMKAPVFGRVTSSWVEETLAAINDKIASSGANSIQLQHFENFQTVARSFPELRSVMFIATACFEGGSTPEKRAAITRLNDICANSDNATIENELVELVTDPVNLRIIYEELEKKEPSDDGTRLVTRTEKITGDPTPPWLTISRTSRAEETPATQASYVPRVAPSSYGPKDQAERAREYAELLSHPEIAMVDIGRTDSNWSQIFHYCTGQSTQDATRGNGKWKRSSGRNMFDLFPGQWAMRATAVDTSNDIRSHDVGVDDPETASFNRLLYEIFSSQKYPDLAWIIDQSMKEHDPCMENALFELLLPIARTPEGQKPPLSLEEVQETAIDIYQIGPVFRKITFSRQDPFLPLAHPETGPHVLGADVKLAIYDDARRKGASSIVNWAMNVFPRFFNAICIISMASSRLPESFWQELESIVGARKTPMIASDPMEKREEILDRFRALYDRYAEGPIREALMEEVEPGMTLARRVTGLDEPWNGGLTWDRLTPTARLRIKAPFLSRIIEARALKIMRWASGKETPRDQTRWTWTACLLGFQHFIPQLKEAYVTLGLIAPDLTDAEAQRFGDLLNQIESSGEEALCERFVDLFTEPAMLRRIHTALLQPFAGDTSITRLQWLTGDSTPPWLPASGALPSVDTSKTLSALKTLYETMQQIGSEKKGNGGNEGQGGIPGVPAAPAPASPAGAPPSAAPATPSASPFPATGRHLSHAIGGHPVITGGLMEFSSPSRGGDVIIEGGESTFVPADEAADAEESVDAEGLSADTIATTGLAPLFVSPTLV